MSTATDRTKRDLERNHAKNQTATSRLSRRTYLLRSLIICLTMAGLCLVRYPRFIEKNTHTGGDIEVKIDHIVTLPLRPKRTRIQGLDHFYMLPPTNTTSDGKPKGLLLHLHSCKESGFEFFTLPEHRIVAYDAIQKGLAVLSPTSYDRQSGCYTSEDANGLLKKVVGQFVRRNRLQSLPIVGLGHSSGGTFLSFLRKTLELQSMAVYNSPEDYGDMQSKNDTLIPTVYLSMSMDESISNRMNANMKRLQDKNITSYLYRVSPKPFTQKLCAARLPESNNGFCKHMSTTIGKDLLDADGYVLEGDVASKQWQRFFEGLELTEEGFCPIDETDSLMYYGNKKSSSWAKECSMRVVLEQEIKACFGYHAMTAQYHDEILNFLISNSKMKENPPPSRD